MIILKEILYMSVPSSLWLY